MKRLLLLLFVLVFWLSLQSQIVYKVISVNGEITTTKSKVKLQNGVEVKSDEKFNFVVPNSRAALINSERGRILLTEQNASNAFAKAAFAPSMSVVSTRSGPIINMIDLKSYFKDSMSIIDKLEIKVGKAAFPMSDSAFFFIRYRYNAQDIDKKLFFNDDTLIIDRKEIFTVDGKPITAPDDSKMKIFYYVSTGENPYATLINSFNLTFIQGDSLKKEVAIILNECKKKPKVDPFAEVYDYITMFYGKIDKMHLEAWLKTNFDLTK